MSQPSHRADEKLNQLSDRDEVWGPLLFLRPGQRQVMSLGRVLALSGLVGLFWGMLGNAMLSLMLPAGSAGKPAVWLLPAVLATMCFACARLSVVAAWNRRARLLSRRLDWEELMRRPAPASARAGEHEAQ
jgi:hypothetical protein